MKNKKSKQLLWTLVLLLAGTTILPAQGWRNANRPGFANNGQTPTCLNYLSDLTDDQKSKIADLEKTHQEAMVKLRTEQRSTFDAVEKNEIRGNMLKKVAAHRKAVKSLLTEEQQEQYDLLHARAMNRGNRQFTGNRGNRRMNSPNFRRGNRGNYSRNFNGCPGYFYNE